MRRRCRSVDRRAFVDRDLVDVLVHLLALQGPTPREVIDSDGMPSGQRIIAGTTPRSVRARSKGIPGQRHRAHPVVPRGRACDDAACVARGTSDRDDGLGSDHSGGFGTQVLGWRSDHVPCRRRARHHRGRSLAALALALARPRPRGHARDRRGSDREPPVAGCGSVVPRQGSITPTVVGAVCDGPGQLGVGHRLHRHAAHLFDRRHVLGARRPLRYSHAHRVPERTARGPPRPLGGRPALSALHRRVAAEGHDVAGQLQTAIRLAVATSSPSGRTRRSIRWCSPRSARQF